MTRFDSLTDQVMHGIYARDALRDSENMMARIAQWDTLRPAEKWAEFDKGSSSRFFDVPGFTPAWCDSCKSEVHPDYRNDPEGECPFCHTWLSNNVPDRAAA
ncbi:hypothetical protein [Microbacterium sp.]|uniref:hypothetical protein n=1 Tax=Microbacterium sp. TaxID=51671 RepID=UPI0039E5387A